MRLHRAVALAELPSTPAPGGPVGGPAVALAEVDGLAAELDRRHLFHAVRADLLRRLGRTAEATAAYDQAIERAANEREVAFLRARRAEIVARGRGG